MSNDNDDSPWDNLAEDLGITAEKPQKKADKPEALPMKPRPKNAIHAAFEQVNAADDEDFGGGLPTEPSGVAALYDPGPDAVADEDDASEGDEAEPAAEGDPTRKKRRRRRRRKGGGQADVHVAEEGDEAATPAANVEEGEAPAEIEGDEDEADAPSAMDEEMEAEVALPRQEWNVMTWNDLVAKLHRPN